ncbi:MAG: LPS export ABC transporter permease LptG [Nitrospirales bacterium]|nr:LPS export ABC transporter permease LptG [Nitrospira sp.]MDR4503156.1 LPS export ABC transporter permease LptG [Nitrospirales bacterium]
MNILDRYIATSVLTSYGLILLLFSTIFSFFIFSDELDQVGTGVYSLQHAFTHVLLTVPGRMIDLAPITALLGSIIGLGALANHQELIAMQAAGVSTIRIAWSVLRVGILFMIMIVVLEEFIHPPLAHYAHNKRAIALADSQTLQSEDGFWFHDASRFIKIGELRYGKLPENIDVYEFDAQGKLHIFTHASMADIVSPNQWILRDVDQKIIDSQGITSKHLPELIWDSFLSKNQVGIFSTPPDMFSLTQLASYLRYSREHGKNSKRLELVFWQKIAMPFTSGAMVLLAIPFIFGPLRSSTTGKRILIGSGIAIAFHFGSQILGQVGLLWEFDPILTTFAPTFILTGIAAWLWSHKS